MANSPWDNCANESIEIKINDTTNIIFTIQKYIKLNRLKTYILIQKLH